MNSVYVLVYSGCKVRGGLLLQHVKLGSHTLDFERRNLAASGFVAREHRSRVVAANTEKEMLNGMAAWDSIRLLGEMACLNLSA